MGHAYQSPLRRWEVLAGLVEQLKAKSFVEVGCKDGKTTGFLLANFPDLHVTAIDPWAPVANTDENYKDWDFGQIERDFWANVGENKDRCEMLRVTSLEAALIKENRHWQYDIIFIDAAHDYEGALQDTKLWWPKVRDGGYLVYHDYQHKFPGVMRAIAKCWPLMRVAVCPDSIAVVRKEDDLKLAA